MLKKFGEQEALLQEAWVQKALAQEALVNEDWAEDTGKGKNWQVDKEGPALYPTERDSVSSTVVPAKDCTFQ